MPNNTAISAFLDFFYIKSTYLSHGIALTKFIDSTLDNWINFDLDNGFISNIANNDGPESEPENPNRPRDNPDHPYKLDDIYD